MSAPDGTVGDVFKAARAVVASHRGPGDLTQILDGLDRLDEALKAHDASFADPPARATCPHSWYDVNCKCGLPPRTDGRS